MRSSILSIARSIAEPVRRYARWLHVDGVPAGTVEKLPEVDESGRTNVPGVYVVGDLAGIPLLKFSADSGARAVQTICDESDFQQNRGVDGIVDIAIVGAGVSGVSAAFEAKKCGLSFAVYDGAQPFSTICDFPKGKPIYAYPHDMVPAGEMRFTAAVKEPLVDELEGQRREHDIDVIDSCIGGIERRSGRILLHHEGGATSEALRAIVAIGRSGNYRPLDVPGEDLEHVHRRLHDPGDFAAQRVVVIGGGDTALESAIALMDSGADVTLSYRGKEFTRPKHENVDAVNASANAPNAPGASSGSLKVALGTQATEIREHEVMLVDRAGSEETVESDVVFTMIGREPPLEFFRRSGIRMRGEWSPRTWLSFLGFVAACFVLYDTKAGGPIKHWLSRAGLWFFDAIPGALKALGGAIGAWAADPTTLLGASLGSLGEISFYYTGVYSLIVVVFGIRRIQRRRTPYVTWQTVTLMAIQVIPLFILPYIALPWMGANGWFEHGVGKVIGDHLFPGGSYWRAFGLILAWPLFVYNIFTAEPIWTWLVIGFIQTFVLIPAMVFYWGKGAYCGWICSCGALAETLGDRHRQKMPHGPKWNRLNLAGQVILGIAFLLLAVRIVGWVWTDSWVATSFDALLDGHSLPGPLYLVSWKWFVDILLAGVVGLGFYFWFSGRFWCRFFCPLAALMHVYARWGRFRIFSEKTKCISCNVCTSVCHQGIDIMSFANKGEAMDDPECVRCSACVQECPTGVLTFGRVTTRDGVELPLLDTLPASPVQMREGRNVSVGSE